MQNGTEKYQKALRLSVKIECVFRFGKTSKTVSKTTFWSVRKSWWNYLIKPVVYWYFWVHFYKMARKSIKKALGLSVKVDDVLRFCQTSKTIGKTTFWSFPKSWSNHLIKPVVYLYFWCHFCEMALQSIKKALGFSVKVAGVLRLRETSQTISKTTFWSSQNCSSKYLIKPVEFWWFLSQKRRIDSKKIKTH